MRQIKDYKNRGIPMKSIKNIFEMAKADKYTADGREEIIKAQKAETQDARRYKTGEISESTGLQKQPDGSWAPPKSTKYGKVTTNKEGKVGIQQTLGKGSKFEEFANEKSASRALANLTAGYNTTERSKEDPHSDKARQLKHWDKETEQIRKEYKAGRRAAHAAQFQNEAGAPPKKGATAGEKQEAATASKTFTFTKAGKVYNVPASSPAEAVQKLKAKGVKGFKESDAFDDSTPRRPEHKKADGEYRDDELEDAAPKVLTGDTRLRLSQVKDARKTYQLGEISQTTGLQKTANGWVKPKQGAGISKSGVDTAHEDKDRLDKALKKQSMPAMAETLKNMDFESEGVKTVNGTNMEVFKKDYGSITAVAVTWQKGNRTGSATKIFNKGHELKPTGVLHNMNIHGVIWS